MDETLESIIAWTLVFTFFSLAITTLTFSRYSLRNIDARMEADGVPVPWAWDRTGLRIGFGAFIIALPIKKYEGQIDPFASLRAIKPYATKTDVRIAKLMIASECLFFSVGILAGIFGFGADG